MQILGLILFSCIEARCVHACFCTHVFDSVCVYIHMFDGVSLNTSAFDGVGVSTSVFDGVGVNTSVFDCVGVYRSVFDGVGVYTRFIDGVGVYARVLTYRHVRGQRVVCTEDGTHGHAHVVVGGTDIFPPVTFNDTLNFPP